MQENRKLTNSEESYFGYLNLKHIDLFGWEGIKNGFKVDYFRKLITNEVNLPPPQVYRIDHNTYQLAQDVFEKDAPSFKDGGHHRAVAHLLENVPLEVMIIDELEELDLGWFNPINIKDIILNYGELERIKFESYLEKRNL